MKPIQVETTPRGWTLRFETLVGVEHAIVLGITEADETVTGGFTSDGHLASIHVEEPAGGDDE